MSVDRKLHEDLGRQLISGDEAGIRAAINQAMGGALERPTEPDDPYLRALSLFGLGGPSIGPGGVPLSPEFMQAIATAGRGGVPLGPDVIKALGLGPPSEIQYAPSGQIMFENGVIADPASGQVLYPTEAHGYKPEDIAGSEAWVRKIQQSWSHKKANEWRKRLARQGYEVAPEGGKAHDLFQALRQYHQLRYLNGGQAVPLRPELSPRAVARQALPEERLREAVRAQYQRIFADDPNEAELADWTDWLRHQGIELAREGAMGEDLAGRAGLRLQERFRDDPKVQFFEEAEEENSELRDRMVAIAQAVRGL